MDFLFVLVFAIANISILVCDVLSELRVLEMDEIGCTVSWFTFKKIHKWEDINIIREDYWVFGKQGYKGIVFSAKKSSKRLSSKKIYRSCNFLNHFYVIFRVNDEKNYSYPVEKEEIMELFDRWNIEVERGRNIILKEKREMELEEGLRRKNR